jgi:Mrp family chromosome partitioning ATPase
MALKLGGTLGYDGQNAPRTLLFISPDPGDGKSTVVSALALVQRDSGERVAVIDANLRRPMQARLLGVDDTHGLTDVLQRAVPVDAAMQAVQAGHAGSSTDGAPTAARMLAPRLHTSQSAVTTVVGSGGMGHLAVLTSGHPAQNPPALLAEEAMPELLRSLAAEYDYVLIDAPSPLEVSDVMPLLQVTDGIVVVARAGHTQSPSATRLMQLLAHTPSSPVLGLVANCVARKDLARYGFAASPDGRASRRRPARR